jgi:hypothetical protein
MAMTPCILKYASWFSVSLMDSAIVILRVTVL